MGKPKFRYRKAKKGWVVEYLEVTCFLFFKKRRWKHYISVAGIESKPWYHSELNNAASNLKTAVHFDATTNLETPHP